MYLRSPNIELEATAPSRGLLMLKANAVGRARYIMVVRVQVEGEKGALWTSPYKLGAPEHVEHLLHEGLPNDDLRMTRGLAPGDVFMVCVDYQFDSIWPPAASSSGVCFRFRMLPDGSLQSLGEAEGS